MATLLLCTFGASANLVQPNITISDWKVAGDNDVITDNNTGIGYLSLRATDKLSYDEVGALLSTTYSGWSFATNEQVETLMQTMYPGLDVATGAFYIDNSSPYFPQSEYFSNVFGNGSQSTASHAGYYYNEDMTLALTGTHQHHSTLSNFIGTNIGNPLSNLCSNRAVYPGEDSTAGTFLVNTGGMAHYSSICEGKQSIFNGTPTLVSGLADEQGSTEIGGGATNVSTPFAVFGLSLMGLGFARARKFS